MGKKQLIIINIISIIIFFIGFFSHDPILKLFQKSYSQVKAEKRTKKKINEFLNKETPNVITTTLNNQNWSLYSINNYSEEYNFNPNKRIYTIKFYKKGKTLPETVLECNFISNSINQIK